MRRERSIWLREGAGVAMIVAILATFLPGGACWAQQSQQGQAQPSQTQPGQAQTQAPNSSERYVTVPIQPPGRATGASHQPAVGITFSQTDDSTRVATVVPGSPAEKVGIQPGDQIVAVDDQPMRSRAEVIGAVAQKTPNVPIRVRFMRDGLEHNVSVQLKPREEVFGVPTQPTQPMAGGGTMIVSGPWLGLSVRSAGQEGQKTGGQTGKSGEQRSGLEVDKIFPAGPAAQAGLYPGDAILKVDGRDVATSQDLANAIRQKRVGETAELAIRRSGRTINVPVVLEDRRLFLLSREAAQMGQAGQAAGQQPVSPAMLQLELERNAAIQRQRIEIMVSNLSQEVHSLRQEIEQLRKQAEGTAPRTSQKPSTGGEAQGGTTR